MATQGHDNTSHLDETSSTIAEIGPNDDYQTHLPSGSSSSSDARTDLYHSDDETQAHEREVEAESRARAEHQRERAERSRRLYQIHGDYEYMMKLVQGSQSYIEELTKECLRFERIASLLKAQHRKELAEFHGL